MPYSEIELEAHEKRDIEVQILNRQDLSPGGHYAGIVVRQKPQKNLGGKTYVLPAVSSLILLKKPEAKNIIFQLKRSIGLSASLSFFILKKSLLLSKTKETFIWCHTGELKLETYLADSLRRVLSTHRQRMFFHHQEEELRLT